MFLLKKKKEEYLKNGCLQILSGRSKYPQLQLKDIFLVDITYTFIFCLLKNIYQKRIFTNYYCSKCKE